MAVNCSQSMAIFTHQSHIFDRLFVIQTKHHKLFLNPQNTKTVFCKHPVDLIRTVVLLSKQ